jgi:hypothetical protein
VWGLFYLGVGLGATFGIEAKEINEFTRTIWRGDDGILINIGIVHYHYNSIDSSRDRVCGEAPMPLQGQNNVLQGQQKMCRPCGTFRCVVCRIVLPGFRPWRDVGMYDVRRAIYDLRKRSSVSGLRSMIQSQIANRKSHLARHNPKITYLCRVIVFGYDGKRI